jgi:hypothetical protein
MSASAKTGDISSKLTLCLQSREGRRIISLLPTASTRELFECAAKEFTGFTVESLKGGGFPPKSIPSNEYPISDFCSNQERIRVDFANTASSSDNKKSKNVGKKKSKSKNSNVKTEQEPVMANDDINNVGDIRRSKRAASKSATEKMPAMIKAQEEYLKNTIKRGSKKSSSFSAVPLQKGKKRARDNSDKQKQSSKPQRVNIAGVGHRLADGAKVSNSPAAPTKRRRGLGDGSTDMSTALLGAINDKGKMGVVLRKGMKNAVQTSYETSRAFSRLAAIQAQSYLMSQSESSEGGGGGGSGELLKVIYQGSVDKTKVEETVDCIARDVLETVLEGIYASNKEALRPENLSRLSPRVLWSLAKYFPTLCSVADMYLEILPALDWNFLRRRAEQLSEKATENKRQEEEKENGPDLERAAIAVASVEHAMENLEDYHAEERKARQPQAAEVRLRRQQQQGEQNGEDIVVPWTLTTPSEPDRDELRECIKHSASTTSVTAGTDVTKWITLLMKQHNIKNWRELANIKHVGVISEKLGVAEQQLVDWIDHAQSESISEIMVEICDGNIEAVEILTEKLKSGTPKDLAGWRSIPDLLLEQLQQLPENVNETNNTGKNDESHQSWMELATISKWCDRAHRALQDYEWINWYATPVD